MNKLIHILVILLFFSATLPQVEDCCTDEAHPFEHHRISLQNGGEESSEEAPCLAVCCAKLFANGIFWLAQMGAADSVNLSEVSHLLDPPLRRLLRPPQIQV